MYCTCSILQGIKKYKYNTMFVTENSKQNNKHLFEKKILIRIIKIDYFFKLIKTFEINNHFHV